LTEIGDLFFLDLKISQGDGMDLEIYLFLLWGTWGIQNFKNGGIGNCPLSPQSGNLSLVNLI